MSQQDQTSLTTIDEPKPCAGKGHVPGLNYKIDVAKAIELRMKGVSYGDIGKVFGVNHNAVLYRLAGLMPPESVPVSAFKQHRADILAAKQAEILITLTSEEIKKASAYQRALMFGVLYDKERLERGETTQNIGLAVGLTSDIEQAIVQRAAVLAVEEIERQRAQVEAQEDVLEAEYEDLPGVPEVPGEAQDEWVEENPLV